MRPSFPPGPATRSAVYLLALLAAQLDERQYEAGFGPCVDAALSGTTISIENTDDSPVYPDFARIARRHGITHTMSTGLPCSGAPSAR